MRLSKWRIPDFTLALIVCFICSIMCFPLWASAKRPKDKLPDTVAVVVSSGAPQSPQVASVQPPVSAKADNQVAAPVAPVVSADDGIPTKTARTVIETIDKAGGSLIDRDLAIIIMAVVMIAIYQVLQRVITATKIPVGKLGWNLLAKALSIIFGPEAAWANRVLAKNPDPNLIRQARAEVIEHVAKTNPLIAREVTSKISV